MKSGSVLEGVGTLVCLGERFPNMRYKMSVEKAQDGTRSVSGTIETLPQRASVQIEMDGSVTLELENTEAVGIVFENASLRRSSATFVCAGPVSGI